jgi:hypothetical protein
MLACCSPKNGAGQLRVHSPCDDALLSGIRIRKLNPIPQAQPDKEGPPVGGTGYQSLASSFCLNGL